MHSMEPPTTPPVGDAAAVGGAAWTPAADCAPGALGYLRSTHALHIRVPTFFSSWFFENEVRGSVCSQATQGVVMSGKLRVLSRDQKKIVARRRGELPNRLRRRSHGQPTLEPRRQTGTSGRLCKRSTN